jgi:hypothetical protein
VIGGNRDGSLDPLADGMLGTIVDPDDDEELAAAISAALSSFAAPSERADRFNGKAFSDHLTALAASNLIDRTTSER